MDRLDMLRSAASGLCQECGLRRAQRGGLCMRCETASKPKESVAMQEILAEAASKPPRPKGRPKMRRAKNWAKVVLSIPPADHNKLRLIALHRGVSMADLVRSVVSDLCQGAAR